jgi:hypothetical protein
MRLKPNKAAVLLISGTVLVLTSCTTPTNSSKFSDITSSIPSPQMPNVVCLDLQAAQDLIQDQGVFLSKSVDASGQGRRQIIDSHWVVVAQNIQVGAPIDEGKVILSVLKEDELDQSTACNNP